MRVFSTLPPCGGFQLVAASGWKSEWFSLTPATCWSHSVLASCQLDALKFRCCPGTESRSRDGKRSGLSFMHNRTSQGGRGQAKWRHVKDAEAERLHVQVPSAASNHIQCWEREGITWPRSCLWEDEGFEPCRQVFRIASRNGLVKAGMVVHMDGRRLQLSSSRRVKSSEVGAKVVCWEPECSGQAGSACSHWTIGVLQATARYPKPVSTEVYGTARRRAQAHV